MASVEEILLNFVGRDNVSGVQNRIKNGMKEIGSAASSANSKFKDMGATAGQVGSKFSSGLRGAQGLMSRLGGIGSSVFSKIASAGRGAMDAISARIRGVQKQLQALGDQMDMGASAIQGALGGIGFTQVAGPAIEGAMNKEQRTIQLTAKFGAGEAERIQAQLAEVAAVTPGDDSVLKAILTKGAMDGNLTSMQQMQSIAQAYAGYAAGSAASGKQMAEVQRDINDYLFNGTTSVLEIDSIYRDHIGELKAAKNVQERIEVINKLNREHYNDILAKSNSLTNVWQMFKGYLTSAATELGMTVLPIVKMVVGALITLNEWTGGWFFKIAIAAAILGTGFLAVFGTIGILVSGIVSLMGTITALGGFLAAAATGATLAGGATFSLSLAFGVLKAAVMSFFLTNPVGWLILIIGAIVTLITVTGKWGDVINWLKGAWNNLVNWGGWKVLQDKINGLVEGAKGVGDKINNLTKGPNGEGKTITETYSDNKRQEMEAYARAIQGAQQWLAEFDRRWKAFWETDEGKQLAKEFGDAIKEVQGALGEVKQALSELWGEIVKAFQPLIDVLRPAKQEIQGTGQAAGQAQEPFDAIGAIIHGLVWVIRIFVFVIKQVALGIRNAVFVARTLYSVLRMLVYGPVWVGQMVFKALADGIQWVIDKVNGLIGAVNAALQPLRDFINAAGQALGVSGGTVQNPVTGQPQPQSAQVQAGNAAANWIQGAAGNTVNAVRTLFSSPLTVNQPGGVSGLRNFPLVKFPQLTPEVMDNIAKGASGGAKGKTVVNTTQVAAGAVQIDATNMNPNELRGVLIDVFESLNKGTAPNKKSTTTA
jgi:hypothetical protein